MTALNIPLTGGETQTFARGMVAGIVASLVVAAVLALALVLASGLAAPAAPAQPLGNPAPAVQVDAQHPHVNGPIVAY